MQSFRPALESAQRVCGRGSDALRLTMMMMMMMMMMGVPDISCNKHQSNATRDTARCPVANGPRHATPHHTTPPHSPVSLSAGVGCACSNNLCHSQHTHRLLTSLSATHNNCSCLLSDPGKICTSARRLCRPVYGLDLADLDCGG